MRRGLFRFPISCNITFFSNIINIIIMHVWYKIATLHSRQVVYLSLSLSLSAKVSLIHAKIIGLKPTLMLQPKEFVPFLLSHLNFIPIITTRFPPFTTRVNINIQCCVLHSHSSSSSSSSSHTKNLEWRWDSVLFRGGGDGGMHATANWI